MGIDVIKIFKSKWLRRSAKYLRNPAQMKELAENAMKFASKEGLEEAVDSVKLIGMYIKAIVNGTYKDYSKSKLALAVAALVYLVVPADCIPDFIPLTGFLDDVTVIGFAIKQMAEELEKFKASIAPPEKAEEEEMQFDEAEEIVDDPLNPPA